MSRDESHKEIVHRYVAALNAGDWATLRELFAPEAVVYGVLGWGGIEQVMPIWRELHEGLRMELTVEEIIAEGDIVAVRYTERGTFLGAFRGQPPTGRSYEIGAMEWFHLRDGRIARRWGARDAAAQARQIGLGPPA
jgi:steroid delta-isomerase-like uncharacterized protein